MFGAIPSNWTKHRGKEHSRCLLLLDAALAGERDADRRSKASMPLDDWGVVNKDKERSWLSPLNVDKSAINIFALRCWC